MKLFDFGVFIIIAIAGLAALGIATKHITKSDDHPIEEYAEEVIEDMIEDALNLPGDSINIDLSPNSKEK